MATHLEYKYVSSATSCRLKLETQEQRFVLASEVPLSSSFSSPHPSREPKQTNGRSSWSSLSGGTKKATPVWEQKQTLTNKSQWRMPWRKSNRIRSEEFRRVASYAAGLSGRGINTAIHGYTCIWRYVFAYGDTWLTRRKIASHPCSASKSLQPSPGR